MARKLSGPVEDAQDAAKLIELILEGQSETEQIETLKEILSAHVFEHGWVDEELLSSICDGIAIAYDIEIPAQETDDEDGEDKESDED